MATEMVWQQFQQQLLGFIKKRINNTADAEDILQEVFIKIHVHLATLTSKDNLSSWIYRIARNTIIDFYRKQKKQATVELLELNLTEEPTEKRLGCTQCLMPLIETLPQKYQEAIVAIELEGLSQKAYAQQLGISYSGAKSRVQRAKIKLQELFVHCCGFKTNALGKIVDATCSCEET